MIPKKIYITHETKEDLLKFKNQVISNIINNKGYEIEFYDDKKRMKFIKEFYPEFYKYYIKINEGYGAVKADIFRVLILHKYGGVYVDCKTQIINIDEVFNNYPDYDFYTVSYNHDKLLKPLHEIIGAKYTNYFMASKSNGIIINKIKNRILLNLKNYPNLQNDLNFLSKFLLNNIKIIGNKERGLGGVFLLTGPVVYTDIIKKNKEIILDINKLKKKHIIYNSGITFLNRYFKSNYYNNSYHFNKKKILNI